MADEEPFRPRMRPRAFLRLLKPDRGAPGGPNLLAWAMFALALFSLARVVLVLRAQDPSSGSRGALAVGGVGTTWLMVAVGALAVLAYALHRPREPAVTLRRDALRRR